MPTFHFLRHSQKIADVVGAQVAKLESLIKQHEAEVGDADQSASSSSSQAKPQGIAGGHVMTLPFILLDLVFFFEKLTIFSMITLKKPKFSFLQVRPLRVH